MKLKKGDRVTWCGTPGTVTEDFGTLVMVMFNVQVQATAGSPKYQQEQFSKDGKLRPWHLEPSLRLVDVPATASRGSYTSDYDHLGD